MMYIKSEEHKARQFPQIVMAQFQIKNYQGFSFEDAHRVVDVQLIGKLAKNIQTILFHLAGAWRNFCSWGTCLWHLKNVLNLSSNSTLLVIKFYICNVYFSGSKAQLKANVNDLLSICFSSIDLKNSRTILLSISEQQQRAIFYEQWRNIKYPILMVRSSERLHWHIETYFLFCVSNFSLQSRNRTRHNLNGIDEMNLVSRFAFFKGKHVYCTNKLL